jgi:hypothetical protein
MSFRRRKNKDFTKATYLALANVMKLLRIGIKAGNGYRTEEEL